MKRNISVSYILAFSKNTWFWLGIWVFYYLSLTDYAGIGLIETVLIITTTVAEIPTGAVADLLGKKRTLIIAFLLEAVGAFIMATAPNLQTLMFSVFVMCVGGAFYSGTLDALVYDSLKQEGKENLFDRKISNIKTISLIAPALCSVIGGFLYKINPTYPFWANGIGYTIGFIASFLLIEPRIDSEKFSFRSLIHQSGLGLKELFKTIDIRKQTILLLTVGFFVVIASEMLDGFLGFEFGFTETELGILWAVIFLISALGSQLTPFIHRTFGKHLSPIIVGIVIAVTFILSPVLGIAMGGLVLTLRSTLEEVFNNISSIVINQNTESKVRATTLSTFNMIKNTPYVFAAYFIGSISDNLSAKTTAFYLGVILLFFITVQLAFNRKKILTN